jgi:hypothetical protein
VAASLFYHVFGRQDLDFRMDLINILLNYGIRSMQRRIKDVDEGNLCGQMQIVYWYGQDSYLIRRKLIKTTKQERV